MDELTDAAPRGDRWPTYYYAEILAAQRWQPTFRFLMVLNDVPSSLDQLEITLRSLSLQEYANWELILIPRPIPWGFEKLVDKLISGAVSVTNLKSTFQGTNDFVELIHKRVLASHLDRNVFISSRGSITRLSEFIEPAQQITEEIGAPIFLGFLSPGDELTPDAIFELAVESALEQDADLLYSDEERFDQIVQRRSPFHKPDWSPDLLLCTNYIGRLWCATHRLFDLTDSTVEELIRFGEPDIVLRCTEAARQIHHIRKILCRRPVATIDEESLTPSALSRALDRRGIEGIISQGHLPGSYNVTPTNLEGCLVSIIILTRGAKGLVQNCVSSLRRLTSHPNYEIVIVDNIDAVNGEAKEWVRTHADKVVSLAGTFNWSDFNNTAVSYCSGDILLFLNDDVIPLDSKWLETMVAILKQPGVGIVGPRLLYPRGGGVQHAGMFLGELGEGRHAFRYLGSDQPGYSNMALMQRNVTAVTGACLMTRRDVFLSLGGFDSRHRIINNDLDYCLKVREARLRCIFTPFTTLIHHERGTRGSGLDEYNREVFQRRWGYSWSKGDPYHHPRMSSRIDEMCVDPEPVEILCSGPWLTQDTIKKILVIKLDHIGDCVAALPAVKSLKRLFEHASLTVISGTWAIPLWAQQPEIDEVIPLDLYGVDPEVPIRNLSELESRRLRDQLRAQRYDLAVDLRRYPETRYLLGYAGARYTAGFDVDGRFPWLDIALEWSSDYPGRAKRQNLSDALDGLVAAIRTMCTPRQPTMSIPTLGTSARLSRYDDIFLRRTVCFHVGAGSSMKRWPAMHYSALMDRLIEEQDVNLAVIGSTKDAAATDAVMKRVRNISRIWVLLNEIPLQDLPYFLKQCDLFVGNDSGPKHIAAALGVPVIGIHSGNVDAREWAPMGQHAVAIRRKVSCSPCYLTNPADCHRNLACLSELRPLDVYPICQRFLALRFKGDCDKQAETGLGFRPKSDQ